MHAGASLHDVERRCSDRASATGSVASAASHQKHGEPSGSPARFDIEKTLSGPSRAKSSPRAAGSPSASASASGQGSVPLQRPSTEIAAGAGTPRSKPEPTPLGPVLVNPAPPSSAKDPRSGMYFSGSLPFRGSRAGAKDPAKSPLSLSAARDQAPPSGPTADDFAFSSILASLDDDPEAAAHIDAIAEICGRSRLSRSDEYTAHRRPVGALGHAGLHHPDDGHGRTALSTVDEASLAGDATSPAHFDGRRPHDPPSDYGYGFEPGARPSSRSDRRQELLRVWECGAAQRTERPTSHGVTGLSDDALGAESLSSTQSSSTVDDDETRGMRRQEESQAVRQLTRVANAG